jgi:hypothetical protein
MCSWLNKLMRLFIAFVLLCHFKWAMNCPQFSVLYILMQSIIRSLTSH